MNELWGLFQKGGYVMYPILLCSVFALAIGVERCMFYNDSASSSDYCLRLRTALQGKDRDALAALIVSKGDCATLTKDFLNNKDLAILENNANLTLDNYEEHLTFLEMIVTVSPLLGLLGTIIGMISAFKVFDLRAGQPFAITSGIGEALIATAFGLIVAIFALAIHALLRYQMERLSNAIKQCCNLLEWGSKEGLLS